MKFDRILRFQNQNVKFRRFLCSEKIGTIKCDVLEEYEVHHNCLGMTIADGDITIKLYI